MLAEQHVSAPRRSRLLGWQFAAHAARFPLAKAPAAAIMTPQPPGIRGMSGNMRCSGSVYVYLQTEARSCA